MNTSPYDNLLAGVHTDLHIGGKWRPASDGARFDVTDPGTEEVVASVASAGDRGREGRGRCRGGSGAAGWAARKPRERGEILRKAYELILRESERLAKLMTLENGKSLDRLPRRGRLCGRVLPLERRGGGSQYRPDLDGAGVGRAHRRAAQAGRHGGAGDAVEFPRGDGHPEDRPGARRGLPVILKPASETPLTALALMPILEEAGVPAGVVNAIPSRRSGAVVGAMLKDLRVRVVSFTGSTEVGRKLIHAAADNVVKPVMELGGNAPFIVFEDADIDAAVDGAMIAKMRNMGEACTSANRFYVHEKVHDAFAEKFAARMKALKLGHGLEEGVALGPLVNAETRDKVVALVERRRRQGSEGGHRREGGRRARDSSIPATVLTERAGRRQAASRGDLRPGGADPEVPRPG